jgi:hypothetical protein
MIPYPASAAQQAVVLARLNEDLYLDVVVSNHGTNYISVLMNNGDGSFAAPVQYASGSAPWGLFAGDLDGDECTDVAVVNHDSRTFSVLLNNGDGTLSLSGTYPSGGFYTDPAWLTGADFDADGDLDIAVVKNYFNLYFTASYVELFTNDGSGVFSPRETITLASTGTATTPIAADLDGDSDIDLAISGFVISSNKLSVLLNQGDGTFADPVGHSSAAGGRACAGDFDRDGDVDFAISKRAYGDAAYAVVLNNGDATFASAYTVYVGPDPRGMTCGDFDFDTDLDIAVAIEGDDKVAVTSNNLNPTTSVADQEPEVGITGLKLHYTHPNPFGAMTRIAYDLPGPARVSIRVYDVSGRVIRTLRDGASHDAGQHAVNWNGRDGSGQRVAPGVYFCRIEADGTALTRRMVLLR